MHNITDYLLLPEQARWAKENGFDGECDYYNHANFMKISRISNSVSNKNYALISGATAVPTFSQFFDWVEEKWGITVSLPEKSADGNWYWKERRYPDKRSAYIARVDAFIKYIDNLKN